MKAKKIIKGKNVRIYEVVLEWDEGDDYGTKSERWRVVADGVDTAISKCRNIPIYEFVGEKLVLPSKKRAVSANLLAETNA